MKLYNCLTIRAPLFLSAVGFFSLAVVSQAVPALPNINTNYICNITNFGASTTITNTTAIQNAINAASLGGYTNGGYGGTVEIPAGTYLSGPLNMSNNVNLQIDTNATLAMLPYSIWNPNFSTTTFIACASITNFAITGYGTINGQATTSDWWNGLTTSSRPYLVYITNSRQMLFRDITIMNPPKMHFAFKSGGGDITFLHITINTSGSSPNTDGMDLTGTNCLVQDCYISDGDDNIALGTSSTGVPSANILVTNCYFGTGHGMTIGSNTQGGVSNLTVINCGFSGTDNGIRMKSDNATTGGGGEGGLAQNLYYYNLKMTNITYAPILIYSYYNKYGNPTTAGITPAVAAATNAATIGTYTPIWRNIIISNLTATAAQPGMIWARTEWPLTNIQLIKITNTCSGSYQNFEIYHAKQVQIVDSQFNLSASANTNFWLFDSDVTFSNTSPSTTLISLYGLTTNSYANSLAFYNGKGTLSATNTLGAGPLTLADSLFTISNNFTLFPTTVLNYVLDTNTNQVAVVGNLAMGGTINVTTNTSGFTAGTNTLLTYTGTLSGALPTLGSTPGGPYTYSLITNTTSKQVSLVVTSTNSSTTTTTSVQSSGTPSTYGNTVTFTATVSPAPTNGESVTFKDGSTTLGTGTLSGGQATYTTTATQLAAGSHSITAVYAGDGAYGASTSSTLTQTVNTRALIVTGLTVNSKTYDRTMAASLNTNSYVLNTVISGDTVTLLTNGYTATFASSNVANGISVTVSGLTLGGAQAGNYTLTQPTGLTGNITALGLTVSGLTVNSKTYDRTMAASLNTNGYALNTVISGDTVTLATNGYTATFASSNVANGISVTVTNLSLGGAQAGNYSLTQPTGLTGNITALGLTVSGLTVNSKIYDGTTGGSLNTNGYALNTVISGDAVTLVTNGSTVTFASPNVANGISVTISGLTLGGAQAGNYTLTQPTGLTGSITPAGSSVMLSSSTNPVAHLSAVTFTATVTPSTLTGTVLFLTNGVAFNTQTLSSGTATSAATSVLPRGTNTITAQYSGDSNYSPSTNTLSEAVTNNPPTANPAVYYRLAGSPLTILISSLATNWSDLDGDTITLAGVSSPSTNGATVTFDSSKIYYTNANNVTDRFGYTISDGQGGTNNGIITVLMAQQTVSSVTVSNNGNMVLDFTGIPGSTYWVMAATNLVPPVTWTPISTNVAGTNGLWLFTDTQATNFLHRFYRTELGH